MRIVSTVPSQTELLFDLGLETEVVGITKFCIHPDDWFRNKTRVGGTKTLDIAKIKSLQPDWVLANKEENIKEQIEACQEFSKVYVSDIKDLESALQMVQEIAAITNKVDTGNDLIHQIENGFLQLQAVTPLKVAYLIWKDPLMTIGQDTFIHDMIVRIGWQNVFETASRYPETSIVALQQLQVDVLLLSSEPYPFTDKHIEWFQSQLPHTRIHLVDGTYFSWYGSRLKDAVAYFLALQKEICLF